MLEAGQSWVVQSVFRVDRPKGVELEVLKAEVEAHVDVGMMGQSLGNDSYSP